MMPVVDTYGRVTRVEPVSLEELGRLRIDVVVKKLLMTKLKVLHKSYLTFCFIMMFVATLLWLLIFYLFIYSLLR